MGLELGQRVIFDKYLTRCKGYTDNGFIKYWHKRTMKPKKGIIIGLRTISDGQVFCHGEGATTYTPDKYYRAALVAYDLHRNPKLVLLSDLNIKTD